MSRTLRLEAGYQIISGAESGAYVFLAPLPSLQEIDNAMARTWGYPDGPGEAAGQAASRIAAAPPEFWSGR